jgi:hypothetical protein
VKPQVRATQAAILAAATKLFPVTVAHLVVAVLEFSIVSKVVWHQLVAVAVAMQLLLVAALSQLSNHADAMLLLHAAADFWTSSKVVWDQSGMVAVAQLPRLTADAMLHL